MNGKQLKNSILQWAIQGKLVPQDPNDEPASVLLERIRAEKKRLIKEGKIKKDKNESIIFRGEDNSHYEKFADGTVKCIDDEIPFEVPQRWEWCRLGSLMAIISDGTHKTPNYTSSGVPFLSVQNISSGRLEMGRAKYISRAEHNKLCERIAPQKGDILLCRIGTLGKAIKVYWDFEFSVFVSLGVLRPIASEITDYIVSFINSPIGFHWIQSVKVGGGTHTYKINLNDIPQMLVCMPPLSEQKRIFEKTARLQDVVSKYGLLQGKLDSLNENLKGNLAKSILQDAIQGKLVPQESSDEPASSLLERIRIEKHKLLKEGKLKKKDVADSVIFKGEDNKYYEKVNGKVLDISEEIPFEIPDTWCWARIKTLYQTTSGGTPEKGHPEYYGGDIPWVKVGDLTSLYLHYASETISKLGLENSSAKVFPIGTILVAMYCNDAIGKSTILASPMATNQAICGLFPNELLYKEYVYFAIQSNKGRLQEQAAGGAQKNINQKIVNELLLPIPPFSEQKRIVQLINELYAHL